MIKIFNKNLNKHIRKIGLNTRLNLVNKIKYLPAFSKEWKNIIYSFNKNNLKNLPSNSIAINKTIKGFFDLFLKKGFVKPKKNFYLKKRRNFLRRIYTSAADIKFTSDKAKITLYVINKEKNALKKKYYRLYRLYTMRLFKQYAKGYNSYIQNIYSFLDEKYNLYNQYFLAKDFINKKKYIQYKLNYLNTFLKLNNFALEKIWIKLIKSNSNKYIKFLRKYSLLYSINQFKFNKSKLLSKLTYFLEKLIGKKLEYNIVNLKSITYHPDIFTDFLALKIKKNLVSPKRWMNSILNKASINPVNNIQQRTRIQKWDKIDLFRNKYRDLKVISHSNNLSKLLYKIYRVKPRKTNKSNIYFNYFKKIHNTIFNSIEYKKLNGIKLEVSGRLTRRYRADRAIGSLKWKGGLKNIDSSFKGLSTVQYKGNRHSNISYSLSKSKRRIGSFAVKGWISSK